MSIADQLKVAPLRKHGGLVVQRTIFEVEQQVAGDAIISRVLNEIAIGQDTALGQAQREKAMHESLHMSYDDGLCGCNTSPDQDGPGQREEETIFEFHIPMPIRGKPARRWYHRMQTSWISPRPAW